MRQKKLASAVSRIIVYLDFLFFLLPLLFKPSFPSFWLTRSCRRGVLEVGSASVSGSGNSFTLSWLSWRVLGERKDGSLLASSGESSREESPDVPDDSGESFKDEPEDTPDKEDCAIARGPVSEGDSGDDVWSVFRIPEGPPHCADWSDEGEDLAR